MRNIWKKPLHKRKVWANVTWSGRLVYYVQPLVDHLFDIWLQQLPFPTLFKCVYTCGLLFFIMLPILYPMMILASYYAMLQYVVERHWHLEFSNKWDLLGAISNLYHFQITNKLYILFVTMQIDRYRIVITAISSAIDYMRMALTVVYS